MVNDDLIIPHFAKDIDLHLLICRLLCRGDIT